MAGNSSISPQWHHTIQQGRPKSNPAKAMAEKESLGFSVHFKWKVLVECECIKDVVVKLMASIE